MANRFNQWAPTQYVGMPIDYYQSSLMLQEQRAAESLDKINGIINAYGSIQAVSPDAEALYNQTIDQLKSNVEGLGKENLTTPQAQRKVNKLLNDPTTVDALDKVYTDALQAAEARKQLNEYLKKNPAVNAVDYLTAFNGLGRETGDATKFNPNRFKNMPALVDYYDVNKVIADEVGKLKANEQEVKRIMGDKYITYKEAGVLEDRIRDLAVSRVMSDPQAKAQFERNVRYTDYLSNPADPNAGSKTTADRYRKGILESKEQITQNLTKHLKGKTQKNIEADKQLQQMIMMADRQTRDYDRLSQLDDQTLNQKMALDALATSFEPYANRQRKYEEEWTPEYLLRLREKGMWERMQFKLKFQKKTLEDALNVNPLTSPDQRQQQELTPTEWSGYIERRIPALGKVKLDQNGALVPENYQGKWDYRDLSSGNFTPNAFTGTMRDVKIEDKSEGTVFSPNDVVPIRQGRAEYQKFVPAGYKKIGTAKYGAGDRVDLWVKPGAGFKTLKEAQGTGYQQGVEQLKEYIQNISPSGDLSRYNDLKTPEGVKMAVQDVVRFSQEFESSYSTPYQLGASNTNSLRASVADIVAKVTVRADGKMADKTDKKNLEEFLRKSNSNAVVNFQLYDRDFDSPVYSVTAPDGKIYKIPMHNEYQQMLGPMQGVISKIVKGKTGVVNYGNDIIINGLQDGQRVNAVFTGGNTEAYQEKAKSLFEENVASLTQAGFSRDEAVTKLRRTASQAADYMRGGDAFPITNEKTGKTAYIKNAVSFSPSASGRSTPTYYSFSQIGDSKVTSIGDLFYNNMTEFGSARNPYMNLPLLDLLKNKNMINLFSAGGDADYDDFDIPEE